MKERKSTIAVLTCDFVDFSKLKKIDRTAIIDQLHLYLEDKNQSEEKNFHLYRGDSIQAVVPVSQALYEAVALKAWLKSIQLNMAKKTSILDIRISIGIGTMDYEGKSILESDGSAFRFSGRKLDEMKQNKESLAITMASDEGNEQWAVILSLLTFVIDSWTIASAEIVDLLLKDYSDTEIQSHLGISQPAVSLRKKHAGWTLISKTLLYFESQFG